MPGRLRGQEAAARVNCAGLVHAEEISCGQEDLPGTVPCSAQERGAS